MQSLDSVMMQNYPEFDVIYIDDCSTDGTGDIVEQYITSRQLQHKIRLIRNRYNRKATANIYTAVHMCNDSDLIVALDGDDALAHQNVLTRIAEIHRQRNAWISYAQFINVPAHKAREWNIPVQGFAMPMPPAVIANKLYRKYNWCWTGLRSFYAWIFKQIKLDDFLDSRAPYENKFFVVCSDNAYFFPLLEMSGIHTVFINEVLLLRNVDTPLNDFKINRQIQDSTGYFIRAKPSYPTLDAPVSNEFSNAKTDLVIIASSPEQLRNSIQHYQNNSTAENFYVLYDNEQIVGDLVKQNDSKVHYFCINDNLDQLLATLNPYVVVTTDQQYPCALIDTDYAVRCLEQTKADRFYFDIDIETFNESTLETLPCEAIKEDCIAWRYNAIAQKLKYQNVNHVYMCKTSQFMNFVQHIKIRHKEHLFKKIVIETVDTNSLMLSSLNKKIH